MRVLYVYNKDGDSYRCVEYEAGEEWCGTDYWRELPSLMIGPKEESFRSAVDRKYRNYKRAPKQFQGPSEFKSWVIQLKEEGKLWEEPENEFGVVSP